jgi:biopolymer transport protein TolR
MHFNTDDSSSSLQSEINITPLVDVVLVLLIIFMVVVPLLMHGYDVDIPRSSAGAAQAQESRLILSVEPTACRIVGPAAGDGLPADCRVTLADQKIPAAELPARVAAILASRPAEKRVLFLAADDRLNYEGVLRILDLAKSGVEDLQVEFIASN